MTTAAERRACAALRREAIDTFLAHPKQRLYQRVALACSQTGLPGRTVWWYLVVAGLAPRQMSERAIRYQRNRRARKREA